MTMSRNRTRQDLHDDIMLSLGHPIVKVNLTPQHLDNCINTAIKKFWRWHHDGAFQNQYVYTPTADDVTNGYFLVPERIDAVLEVLNPNDWLGRGNFATAEWQMTAATVLAANRFVPMTLTDFMMAQQQVMNTRKVIGDDVKLFDFVRLQHRVIPRFKMVEGQPVALRVYENLDPDADEGTINSELIYDNETLKDLATALAKQQWGMILKRFSGMTLPGGVQIDGESLVQEGKEDESEVMQRLKGETVVNFFMG